MCKHLRFTGKFKELIPLGYTFHKLFARNHKVYHKNSIWIFVADRDVIIRDFSGHNCAAIAKAIINNKYPVYKESINYGMIKFEKGEPKAVMVDIQKHTITSESQFIKDNGHEYDYDRYRGLIIGQATFNEVKRLYKSNLIEIGQHIAKQ